jgi:hypothetical protein
VVVVYFKALSWCLPGGNDEAKKNLVELDQLPFKNQTPDGPNPKEDCFISIDHWIPLFFWDFRSPLVSLLNDVLLLKIRLYKYVGFMS